MFRKSRAQSLIFLIISILTISCNDENVSTLIGEIGPKTPSGENPEGGSSSGKLYWIDSIGYLIRANLDGSNAKKIWDPINKSMRDFVADEATQKIYYATFSNEIGVMDLDGSNDAIVGPLVGPLPNIVNSIDFEPSTRTVYGVTNKNEVWKRQLDASAPLMVGMGLGNLFDVAAISSEEILISGYGSMTPIISINVNNYAVSYNYDDRFTNHDIDRSAGQIYYLSPNHNIIPGLSYSPPTGSYRFSKTDLDGSNEVVLFDSDAQSAIADIAIDPETQWIYYADRNSGNIYRVDQTGNQKEIVASGVNIATFLEILN